MIMKGGGGLKGQMTPILSQKPERGGEAHEPPRPVAR